MYRFILLLLFPLALIQASHCETACTCCGTEDPVETVMGLIEKISGEHYNECSSLANQVRDNLQRLFACAGVEECPSCAIRKTVLGIMEESDACCDHQLEVALSECVPLTSDLGRRLLKESKYQRDLLPLLQQFEVQHEGWWCGVATATMVLNALPIERAESKYADYRLFTQERFFDDPVAIELGLAPDNKSGISLEQLGQVLDGKEQVSADVHPMSVLKLAPFREQVKCTLKDGASYVIVNYSRSVAGQGSGAHFSPVAAYHEGVDAVLILDTAKFKYSPFWMPVDLITRAMNTADSKDETAFRGYLVAAAGSGER